MDYRNRNYYLVNIPFFSYDMRIKYFKLAAPSLKIHAPYNHIKWSYKTHDFLNGKHWQMMISCKKDSSDAIEYELRKMVRNDGCNSAFEKLSKEICGQ